MKIKEHCVKLVTEKSNVCYGLEIALRCVGVKSDSSM